MIVRRSRLDAKPSSHCAAAPTRTRTSGVHASCWRDGLRLCSHPSDCEDDLLAALFPDGYAICHVSSSASLLMKPLKTLSSISAAETLQSFRASRSRVTSQLLRFGRFALQRSVVSTRHQAARPV